jgi:uncharacterized protein
VGKEHQLVQSNSKPGTKQPTREELLDRADVVLSQRGRGETFANLLQRRISRRGVLKAGLAAGAMVVVNPLTGKNVVGTPLVAEAQVAPGSVKYTPIPPQPDDAQQVMIADGYSWAPFAKWGDPIRAGAPAYDPTNLSAWAQEQQVGYNCDYIGYHPLPFYDKQSRRGLLWINHEYTNGELMWADYESQNPTKEQADVELAAHGGSVLEVIRGEDGRLSIDMYSPYNRRITATTPMRVSGPAAGHDWLKTQDDPTGAWVIGTLNNCAGGFTPWGTVLTCEENFQGYFGNLDLMDPADPRTEVHARYGIEGEISGYGWEQHYGRFAVTNEPNEPFRFGWVVEIDPYDPDSTPVKRTALGRFRHEGATFGYSPSGRVVFYSGDDQRFDYVYKYVSDNAYDPIKRGMAQGLLDEGVLYVAKFNEDGAGEWLPLVYGENGLDETNGFTSQGDVLVKTRIAADLLGATKMDRPEDIQQNPVNHKIYAAMTNNSQRTEEDVDAANPRPENRSGQVIEIEEADGDAASTTFTWDIFLLCGDPNDESTYFAGFPKDQVSPIACPDNVNFDHEGNLWISTDGQPAPLGIADGLYAVPTEGPQRGFAAQFLSVVTGAECASFEFVHDYHNLVVSLQHPGEGGTVAEPVTTWPDGSGVPRPTVIQVWKNDGGRINS